MNYTTFQRGTLVKRPNREGFSWVLRYRQDGKHKAVVIGTSDELPTEKDAQKKAASLTAVINESKSAFTFGQLVEKYLASDEIPSRPQTAASYKSAIRHLVAQFEEMPLHKMFKDVIAIERWLSELKTISLRGIPARPLSMKSKQNIKATLHRLINCAMKWGFMDFQENPVAWVEIKKPKTGLLPKKRLKVPLTEAQVTKLLAYKELSEHVKVMSKLCVLMGLRISEVLGLKWEDIDFERNVINIVRSSVGNHVDETKSETSAASLPMHKVIAELLMQWQASSTSKNGWLFENVATGRPFHRDSLQADHLAPAGKACGIINLGWHSFRHSHRAFLRAIGADLETQKLLMRHANLSTTMDYGVDDELLEVKRATHEAVVDRLLNNVVKAEA